MNTKLMSAQFAPVVCALGLALSLAGSTMAQDAEGRDQNQNAPPRAAESRGGVEPQAVAATAPNARMAALIRAGGTIISQRNVARVRNPRAGIYCILPAAGTGIVPNRSIVLVTVDFFYSRFNESTAQWASRGSPCDQTREIAVYTFVDLNLTARYSFSNTVGFSVYVP